MADPLQLGFSQLVDYERETLQQIHDLLYPEQASPERQGVTPMPLTIQQRQLLLHLKFHCGRQRAVPLAELCERQKLSEREVKNLMRSLVVDFKVRIGAARTQPNGYYLITTAEEAREAAQVYESEIVELAKRVRVLRGKHFVAELLGQLRIANEEEKAS